MRLYVGQICPRSPTRLARLTRRVFRGPVLEKIKLTREFDCEAYKACHVSEPLPWLVLLESRRLLVMSVADAHRLGQPGGVG